MKRAALASVLLARLLGGSLKIGFIGGTPEKGIVAMAQSAAEILL